MEVHRRLDILYEPCHPHIRTAATQPDEVCVIEGNTTADYTKKLDEIKAYLKEPEFQLITNQQSTNLRKFGNESIAQTSVMINKQFDAGKPTFIDAFLHLNELEDDTDYIRIGQEPHNTNYTKFSKTEASPSSWTDYKGNRYKFISFDLFMSSDKQTTFRETYQTLDFLGDIGGLLDICHMFLSIFISWVA